jgi:hypothetical protein
MSDPNRVDSDAELACCVTDGCGIRFDPAREGFNGECDACAAVAADHFTGVHRSVERGCPFCRAESPAEAEQLLVAA